MSAATAATLSSCVTGGGDAFPSAAARSLNIRVVIDGGAKVLNQKLHIEIERREVIAEIAVAYHTTHRLGEDFDAFAPKLLEFIGGKLHVVKIVEQRVELVITSNLFFAETGSVRFDEPVITAPGLCSENPCGRKM